MPSASTPQISTFQLSFEMVLLFESGGSEDGKLSALDTLATPDESMAGELKSMLCANCGFEPYNGAKFRTSSEAAIRTSFARINPKTGLAGHD